MDYPELGTALPPAELKRDGIYYEEQVPGSDTCGLNALNNLCQRNVFALSDLQNAEAAHAVAQDRFGHGRLHVSTGFFDVEALKLAARSVDLEILEVDPVAQFDSSLCRVFPETARASVDGSWFLGFLVYDRRPGGIMHYYALRRNERHAGVWLKLDSQKPQPGEEIRNRRMTSEDLRDLYDSNAYHFQNWHLRWYPVVYRKGAARELVKTLEKESLRISDQRSVSALSSCSWNLVETVRHLIEDLPKRVFEELLVNFTRPCEAEFRQALIHAKWDVTAAWPAIHESLRQRSSQVEELAATKGPLRALSLCDWDPPRAARLLSLQLQCDASEDALSELHEALELVGGDVDKAEAALTLLPEVSGIAQAAALLEKSGPWSLPVARRVLQVQKRVPRVVPHVAIEVLRRNDDDPHAACEMLDEFQKQVQKVVVEVGDDLVAAEVPLIAETALIATDWDPKAAFSTAKTYARAVVHTKKILRQHRVVQPVSVEAVLSALTASNMNSQEAASLLMGSPVRRTGDRANHDSRRRSETDEDGCTIA